jgi:hypothetical protein
MAGKKKGRQLCDNGEHLRVNVDGEHLRVNVDGREKERKTAMR